ncbi:NAPDH-dependent diflavin reductase, partial [Ascosphaera atra]
NDGTFIPWSVDLRNFLLTTYPLPSGLEPLPEDVALPPDWVLDLHEQIGEDESASPFARCPEMNNDDRPLPDAFTATLTENARVTSPSHWQDVRQLTLTAPGPIPYGPGDILRIMPRNFAADVDFLISLMGWGKDADLPLKLVSGSPRKRDILPSHPSLRCLMENPGFTLRRLLTDFLDIRAVPRRSFFGNLSHFTNDTAQKERLLEFSGADYLDELYDYTTRPRRSILEILQEFDSVKLPWQHVLSVLPLLRSRQFSIASGGCQKTIDGGSNANFELLIAIVKYQTIIRKTREGVCTRYVASLPTGSTLKVQLERGVGLNISTKQLIQPSLLVGPGTGVAPLRAMLWEKLAMVEAYRARHGQDAIVPIGPTVLFFGGRGRENDYFYEKEWEELRKQLDFTVVTAFSRDQRQKIYVQDRIRENAETVGRLILEQMGTVYVCGSSGKMPQAVREALLDCLEKHEGEDALDRKAAEEYLERMEREGRYRQETW